MELKKYSKQLPLWYKLKGYEMRKCATILGIGQYMRARHINKGTIVTVQGKEETEVNHIFNGLVVELDELENISYAVGE